MTTVLGFPHAVTCVYLSLWERSHDCFFFISSWLFYIWACYSTCICVCVCHLNKQRQWEVVYLISLATQREEEAFSVPGSSISLAAHVLITRPSTRTYVPCLSGSTRYRLVTCFTNHSNSTRSLGTRAKLHISAQTCQHNDINSLRNMMLAERRTNTAVCRFDSTSLMM